MSYARFGVESDVYVFLHINGTLTCCGCRLDAGHGWFATQTTNEMVKHLNAHRSKGHRVLDSTYDSLQRDAVENDAWISVHARAEALPPNPTKEP